MVLHTKSKKEERKEEIKKVKKMGRKLNKFWEKSWWHKKQKVVEVDLIKNIDLPKNKHKCKD